MSAAAMDETCHFTKKRGFYKKGFKTSLQQFWLMKVSEADEPSNEATFKKKRVIGPKANAPKRRFISNSLLKNEIWVRKLALWTVQVTIIHVVLGEGEIPPYLAVRPRLRKSRW